MTEDKKARVLELLKAAAEEQDGDKLIKLTDEILKLMEEVQRERKGRDPAA